MAAWQAACLCGSRSWFLTVTSQKLQSGCPFGSSGHVITEFARHAWHHFLHHDLHQLTAGCSRGRQGCRALAERGCQIPSTRSPGQVSAFQLTSHAGLVVFCLRRCKRSSSRRRRGAQGFEERRGENTRIAASRLQAGTFKRKQRKQIGSDEPLPIEASEAGYRRTCG